MSSAKARAAIAKNSAALSLTDLPAIGPAMQTELQKAGIKTYWDLFRKFLELGPTGTEAWIKSLAPPGVTDANITDLVAVLVDKKKAYDRV